LLEQIQWSQGMEQPQDIGLTAAAATSVGQVGYIDSNGMFALALATGTGTIPAVLCAVDACEANRGGRFRPWGVVVNKDWSWTAGNKLYLSTATAGALTASAPTTYILPVAVALSATAILLYPSMQNDYTPNTQEVAMTVASGGGIDFASGSTLKIAGVTVSATATEVNALVGSALTTTSAAKLQAITATATEINSLVGSGLTTTSTAKLQAINATATEINSLVGSGLTTTSTAKLQALTPTSTALNLMLQSTTAGYKLARGTASVTTSSEIATGLATVVAGVATLIDDPNITAMFATVAASTTAGNILMKLWQPTATNNVTPQAATKTSVNVQWEAVGT